MLKLFTSSFSAYPWRMRQTVLTKSKSSNVTITVTGLVEAQSKTQVRMITNQPVGPATSTTETIVISPTVYIRVTGIPSAQSGVPEGWTKYKAISEAGFVGSAAVSAADPVQAFRNSVFKELLAKANADQKEYKLVGTEPVNGLATNVYEIKLGTVTYRTSVGHDGRIYKMQSDSPTRTATTIVEYDPSIKITAPIP